MASTTLAIGALVANEDLNFLLTNRVHPTRENNPIRDTRAQVADAVVRSGS